MEKEIQIKKLSQALLISGILNVGILTLFFYWVIREVPPTPYCERKPATKKEQQAPLAIESSNGDIIRLFRSLTLEQLVSRLNNNQMVENGYSQRDLALAALMTFHYFDLERALKEPLPKQQRTIPFGKNVKGETVEITIYPGLSEAHFQSMMEFAKQEKWPLTSKGLYRMLRKQGLQYETSLAEAFFMTPEFLHVEMLFQRSGVAISKQELLAILLQGNWNLLSTFAEQQRAVQDLSSPRRQRFLLDYIRHKSATAAQFILKSDGEFAAKKLDDKQVIAILDLAKERNEEVEKFAITLLTSPRNDFVRQAAAEKLFEIHEISKPKENIYAEALNRFVPQAKGIPLVPPKPKKSTATQKKLTALKTVEAKKKPELKQPIAIMRATTHKVQEGDSLWKIAKKYKVSIESIKKTNHLKSDFLKPGTTLRIP